MQIGRASAYRYRRLAGYAKKRWPALLAILALTLITAVLAALQPWPIKLLVDYALTDTGLPGVIETVIGTWSPAERAGALIMAAAGASLLLFVLSSLLDIALTLLWSANGQRMVYDFATDLFDRLCALTLVFHSRQPVGDSLSRLSIDSYSVFAIVQGLLVTPFRHLLTLCTVAGFAWLMDPLLTVLSFVLAPIMVITSRYVGLRLKAQSLEQRETQSRVMSFVQRTLTVIPVVQAFGAEQRNRAEFEQLSADAVASSQRSVLLMNGFNFVNGFTMTIGTSIVLYIGSQRVMAGVLTIGSLLVFIAYLQTIRAALLGLASIYGSIKVTEASIDRVLEIMDSTESLVERSDATELEAEAGDIVFDSVTVGYAADHPVLRDVSFTAHAGETIALVGRTGSGKSTLVSLLPRFLDPWSGRVTVAGHDVRDLRLSSLRSRIGLVLQEPFLLPISVAANIAYGRPEASQEEVIAAARAANADEFIRELPDGYDTVLGERGSTLSGGQAQRLSIARALLKDAPVLILDEPTSALDAETESLLLAALERLMRGRTTFIIAHRLSTIRNADRILVLEDGRIVESGRHDELMAAGGAYAAFHHAQHHPDRGGAP